MKQEIFELLKEHKVKITNERKAIIGILEAGKLPLSPAEIYFQVKPLLPKANLTTVYRNLEMLEGFGLVKRLGFNKNYFSYELASSRNHHHHVVCQKCGLIEELDNISEKFVSEVSSLTNFKIEDHNLEFFGLCERCQKI